MRYVTRDAKTSHSISLKLTLWVTYELFVINTSIILTKGQVIDMEQPHKRRRISVQELSEADIHERRVRNDMRLKSELDSIYEKYSKDFSGVGDIIDFVTGKIVVDHGHVSAMKNEKDPGCVQDMDDELGLQIFSATYGKVSRKTPPTKINFQSFKDSLCNSAADTSEASWQSADELGLDFLHRPWASIE